ncbi:MAG: VCBS repeat-containing protein [Anaerolineae bacterium]|nr:VCBS repeat-containing protein [Anaerolineae bacterium]
MLRLFHLKDKSKSVSNTSRFWIKLAVSLSFSATFLLLVWLMVTPVLANLDGDYTAIGVDQNTTRSIAWGDVDNDGDLDLAVGNFASVPNRLYINDNGTLQTEPAWIAFQSENTVSVAWADMDNDGDLDLAVGNYEQPNHVYRNDNGKLTSVPVWSSNDNDKTRSVAWGDVDSDGWLDLASGNGDTVDKIYTNQNGTLSSTGTAISTVISDTQDLAWGDWDNDGDPDLAVANFNASNRIYENNNGTLVFDPDNNFGWESGNAFSTYAVAWGDVNDDGWLDLATANSSAADRVYLNYGGTLSTWANWVSPETGEDSRDVDWGDIDNDGDLDLAFAQDGTNTVFLNTDGALGTDSIFLEWDVSDSVAWGDVDNDGDLDLAVGNSFGVNKLYLNTSEIIDSSSDWGAGASEESIGIAWGDVDGDGDLDLAVANGGLSATDGRQPNHVYLNEDGALQKSPVWTSTEIDQSWRVAWGDVDGDNDLDLAVANGCTNEECDPNRLYRNDGLAADDQTPILELMWTSNDTDRSLDAAWGDVDSDGDLDLAVANWSTNSTDEGAPNKLYLNVNGVLQPDATWVSTEAEQSHAVAWGDVDGDGDLDLAVANRGSPNHLYLNDGKMLQTTTVWTSADSDMSRNVAWGDVDGDGDLDLAVANDIRPTKVYLNENGMLHSEADWATSTAIDQTWDAAWGDADGDGDLDLAVANLYGGNRIYFNQNGQLDSSPGWHSTASDELNYDLAWGDMDGDGDLDLATAAQYRPNRVYINRQLTGKSPTDLPPRLSITYPAQVDEADFWPSPAYVKQQIIPISYTLFDPNSNPAKRIFAEFSLNGGGQWFPATAASGTAIGDLDTSPWPTGINHVFYWDAEADLIRASNVVFRIRVQPNYRTSPVYWGAIGSQTFPFGVEAAEWYAKVVSSTQPISGAVVYQNGELISQGLDKARLTNKAGLVRLNNPTSGEALVALALVHEQPSIRVAHEGWAYRTYVTNLNLDKQGAAHPDQIGASGQQLVTVHSDDPLVLFNIVVSVEWDATPSYLSNLAEAFRNGSDYLYDVTDGQMAFGQVTIYDEAENWEDADFQVSTKSIVVPHALSVGGIVSTDKATSIRVGRFWDGDSGNQGLWKLPAGYRTLIHEFGHYGLHLHDEYFLRVVDAQGYTSEIDAFCTDISVLTNNKDATNASIMFYQYNASELADQSKNWNKNCKVTEQFKHTGESDWETVLRHYNGPGWNINTPNSRGTVMAGPDKFPVELLPFPEVKVENNGSATGNPHQLTVYRQGQPVFEALVSLYVDDPSKGVKVAIDQGLTNRQGQIEVYGATPGDTILASSLDGTTSAVVKVEAGKQNYKMDLSSTSQSGLAIQVGPTTPYLNLIPPATAGDSLTLRVHDALIGGLPLNAVIIPDEQGQSPQFSPLVYDATVDAYSGSVSFSGASEGTGRAQINGLAGGQQVTINSDYSYQQIYPDQDNHLYAKDGNFELHIPVGGAPAAGSATVVPTGFVPRPLPSGRDVIGSAYEVRLSGALSQLDKDSVVRLHYHPEVMGNFTNIAIYYWNGQAWQLQGGEPGDLQNAWSVTTKQLGVYALMGQVGPDNAPDDKNVFLPLITKE